MIALVLEERAGAQYGEAVREAAGDEQLAVVLSRKFYGHSRSGSQLASRYAGYDECNRRIYQHV